MPLKEKLNMKNTFMVSYVIQGVKTNYYRFILHPEDPSAKYSIKDGRLIFDSSHLIYDLKGSSNSVSQTVKNYFNVQANFSNDFATLIQNQVNRKKAFSKSKTNYLIVDIPVSYFNRAQEMNKPYQPVKADKNFLPNALAIYQSNLVEESFQYTVPKPKATGQVFCQQITTTRKEYFYDEERSLSETNQALQVNPLVAEEGDPHLQIVNYDEDMYGLDLILPQEVGAYTAGYRREKNGKADWCTHTQEKINRESYLMLTGAQGNTPPNAEFIAKLFDDYARKGTGFSALIHFHLFRHNANVQVAKAIAHELQKNLKDADAPQLADFLVEKFNELAKRSHINPTGSFARRMNYALLQLTGGMCASVKEYESYQSQKAERSTLENT